MGAALLIGCALQMLILSRYYGWHGGWAFGCDICNDACPWNEKFATPTTVADFAVRAEPDRSDPATFDTMSEAEFAEHFADNLRHPAQIAAARGGLNGLSAQDLDGRRTVRSLES